MAIELSAELKNAWESIQEQPWFTPIRSKWDELDIKSKQQIKWIGLVGALATLGLWVLWLLWDVSDQRAQLEEQEALITKLENSQNELRKLKETTSGVSNAEAPVAWDRFIEGQVTSAGVAATSLKIEETREISDPKSRMGEKWIKLSLEKINVRQMVKIVYNLENGGQTFKVRNMEVLTEPDLSGYLNVRLIASAFQLAP